MSFDAVSSHIRCHFNEVLVGLMREVRQLQGLGYRMKQQLTNEVDIAARFYRWVGSESEAARSHCGFGAVTDAQLPGLQLREHRYSVRSGIGKIMQSKERLTWCDEWCNPTKGSRTQACTSEPCKGVRSVLV
jgi:hypothetical protein